ncbi:cytochrome c3 family protein [Acidobacteriota bacterium]
MFTKKFDRRIYIFLAVVALSAIVGASFALFALWPANVETGYEPEQPIAYSHVQHPGELKMDCQYCHSNVDTAAHANIPTVKVCMGCHAEIESKDDQGIVKPEVAKLKKHWEEKKPIEWINVHNLADFVYFDHSRHIKAEIECEECHGDVKTMDRVQRVNSLKMGWCLDCHQKPPPEDYPITDGRKTWASVECFTCHR